MEERIAKSRFKARALESFRRVQETGEPIIVTDRGRPGRHNPADRVIVAPALTLGAALVTKDDRLLAYPPVKTLW